MAGIVKADAGQGLPGTHRRMLYPRACPCRTADSGTLLCMEASDRSAWVNLCPFFYGARVLSGGMIAEIRTVQDILVWVDYNHADGREWEVLCLRKESSGTKAGARLRD